MGGMAAYIPNKKDAAANQTAMEQVRTDKEREAADGMMVPGWRTRVSWHSPKKYSMSTCLHLTRLSASLRMSRSRPPTYLRYPKLNHEAGLRQNIAVSIGTWSLGCGCRLCSAFNLMEDAAIGNQSNPAVAVDTSPGALDGRSPDRHGPVPGHYR